MAELTWFEVAKRNNDVMLELYIRKCSTSVLNNCTIFRMDEATGHVFSMLF
jgi:hypothetical protein